MNAPSTAGRILTFVLGIGVLSFVIFTTRAKGDEHIGTPPRAQRNAAKQMPELPDVILITVDTLRADRLGAYGYADAKTPNLDKLARGGVMFANATVPLPRTTPGLASLLTGLSPESHGSREVWQPVDVETGARMAEVFSDAGYATVGLSANSAAGRRQGLAKGFDRFLDQGQIKRKRKRDDADVVTSEALKLAKGVDASTPMFLWVHYVDPHWKYSPPKKWKDQPKGSACRDLQRRIKSKTEKVTLGDMFSDRDGIATAAMEDCKALYDAEVSFTDAQIGKLINGLRDLERWDDAIVAFTADHGENMGEDGLYFAHGPSLADAALRVPLILHGPTIPRRRTDGGIVRIQDVMPTLLELAQVPRSQWPQMEGNSLQWRWNDELEYPESVVEYAVAEAGGALHPDTVSYVVSGRQKSRYCYNDERYSMCFEVRSKLERGSRRQAPGDHGHDDEQDDAGEDDDTPDPATDADDAEDGDGDDDEQDAEDGDDEQDAEDGDDEQDAEDGDDEDDGRGSPDDDGASGEDGDDETTEEFFDRKNDPGMEHPLEDVPPEILEKLLAARERWSPESTRLRAVRNTTHKLVAYPQLEGGYRYALYDLRADPSESTDVSAKHPRTMRRMMEALEDWGSSIPTFVAKERSESELDELRALGYVQ